jgi:hypothetical protein
MDTQMEHPIAPVAPNKKFVGYFVAGLVCILLLAVGGAYSATRSALKTLPPSNTALQAAEVLRISVLSVNGEKVPYTEFYRTYDTMSTIARTQSATPTTEQLSDAALIQVAGTKLMEEVAKKLDVTVTDDDIQNGKAMFLSQNGLTEEEANTQIQENLGWSFDE